MRMGATTNVVPTTTGPLETCQTQAACLDVLAYDRCATGIALDGAESTFCRVCLNWPRRVYNAATGLFESTSNCGKAVTDSISHICQGMDYPANRSTVFTAAGGLPVPAGADKLDTWHDDVPYCQWVRWVGADRSDKVASFTVKDGGNSDTCGKAAANDKYATHV